MQWLRLSTFTCLLFVAGRLAAQSSGPDTSFGLRAGYTHGTYQDRHASPLVYTGHTVDLGTIYRRTGKNFLEVSFTVSIGTNQSARHGRRFATLSDPADIYGAVESYVAEINPFLSLLRGQLRARISWPVGAGHSVGVEFNAMHWTTGIGADTWHYTQLDLGPVYRYQGDRKRGNWHASVGLPVAALTVRPTWAKDVARPETTSYYWGFVRENTRFATLGRLFNPKATVGLEWARPESGKAWGLDLSSQWIAYPLPRPMRVWERSLALNYFF